MTKHGKITHWTSFFTIVMVHLDSGQDIKMEARSFANFYESYNGLIKGLEIEQEEEFCPVYIIEND